MGDLEVAGTGLTEREADTAGFVAVTETVASTTRAGYYPGASPLTVKVITEHRSGRLLGGPDRRRGRRRKTHRRVRHRSVEPYDVDDLINVDLSYAPPVAPLWDPVLIAARKAGSRSEPPPDSHVSPKPAGALMLVVRSLSLFVVAAVAEIGGAYLVWQGLREGRGWPWVLAGALALAGYGAVATLQPEANFGRIFAAYGGVFIVGSILWGMAFEGFHPDRWDLIGGTVSLVGMTVMMYGPRP